MSEMDRRSFFGVLGAAAIATRLCGAAPAKTGPEIHIWRDFETNCTKVAAVYYLGRGRCWAVGYRITRERAKDLGHVRYREVLKLLRARAAAQCVLAANGQASDATLKYEGAQIRYVPLPNWVNG